MSDSRLPAPRARSRPALAAALGVLAALAACGGAQAPAATPAPAARGDVASASGDAASARAGDPAGSSHAGRTGDRPGQDQAAVTEAECRALLAHVVAIANQAHTRTVAPELAPTEEQLADIRARMAPEFMPMCLGLDRATLACEMRAASRDALLACAQ